MKFDSSKSVFYERYKPQCIDDLIVPDEIKDKLKSYIKTQDIPNLGLWSTEPGLGKSSTANAIVKELGCEALWLNASMEKGIDVLRGKIQRFASQVSFDGGIKIVVMDEFDNFSRDGMASFRGFLDEFSQNCRFIFTGNYKEKIIEPLLDRLENYEYSLFDKKQMIKPIFERLKFILDNEGIEYDQKDVAKVIQTYYPRIRSMVGCLQKLSTNGKFVVSDSVLDDFNVFDNVMQYVNASTYLDMISEVNKLNSPDNMYKYLYANASKFFKPEQYPNVVLIIAKYQHWSEGVRDKNLNLSACLTELIKLKS